MIQGNYPFWNVKTYIIFLNKSENNFSQKIGFVLTRLISSAQIIDPNWEEHKISLWRFNCRGLRSLSNWWQLFLCQFYTKHCCHAHSPDCIHKNSFTVSKSEYWHTGRYVPLIFILRGVHHPIYHYDESIINSLGILAHIGTSGC